MRGAEHDKLRSGRLRGLVPPAHRSAGRRDFRQGVPAHRHRIPEPAQVCCCVCEVMCSKHSVVFQVSCRLFLKTYFVLAKALLM